MFHWFKRHTKDGMELPDPTPNEVTLQADYKRPLTLAEQIARFTQAKDFQDAIQKHGLDTLEEANDLDVDDDTEALFGRTPYEMREDVFDGVQTNMDEIRGGQVQEPSQERMQKAYKHLDKVRQGNDKKNEKALEAPAA